MKQSLLLVLTALLAAPILAQQPISDAPPQPAAVAPTMVAPAPKPAVAKPATAKPAAAKSAAAKPAAKPVAKKKTPAKPAKLTSIVPGLATVAGSNINVRAQATVASEIVTRLHRGEPVMVQEIVTLKTTLYAEPAQWAKIAFPPNAHVFINTGYINRVSKTVSATRINLRAGPGENYTIVGRLPRGAGFTEITTKGAWMEIEPPSGAVAFVAAEYLSQAAPAVIAEAPVAPPTITSAEPAPAPIMPAETAVASAPVEPPPAAAPALISTPVPEPMAIPAAAPIPDPTPTPLPAPAAAAPPVPAPKSQPETGPLTKRIVQREGKVRYTTSIQAPSEVALNDLYEDRTMDYLVSPTPELKLKRYHDRHVLVTGEEALDSRWPNTPILIVHRILLAD